MNNIFYDEGYSDAIHKRKKSPPLQRKNAHEYHQGFKDGQRAEQITAKEFKRLSVEELNSKG